MSHFEVVIAGGGVAALETVLALRDRAPRVEITLVAPNDHFVYRPWQMVTPFRAREARRLDLTDFCEDNGVRLVHGSLHEVDAAGSAIATEAGQRLGYDALIAAVGARPEPVSDPYLSLLGRDGENHVARLIKQIRCGEVRTLAIAIPSTRTWPLPGYEVALLAAHDARERDLELSVVIFSAEGRPLEVFGAEVSEAAARILSDAGVDVVPGASGQLPHARGARNAPHAPGFDRVLVVPELSGPSIPGLPCDEAGFVKVMSTMQVEGLPGVFAVGDATTFPVKQGGIAAQQADRAVGQIAGLSGRPEPATPDAVEIHGMLVAGRRAHQNAYLYLSARLENGQVRESRVSDAPTWAPPAKIAARYLGPYLDKAWGAIEPGVADWHAWSYTETTSSGN
jgi:sulfide:quinone oxidoreductase